MKQLARILVAALALGGAARAQSLPANALPVPIIPQATNYSCGPATLSAVLHYWRVFDGGESDLYAALGTTPADGTEPQKMADYATSKHLTAEFKTGLTVDDLRDALAHGKTVILDIQAWSGSAHPDYARTWEDGHYVVLVGLDDTYAYVEDPEATGGYEYVTLTSLAERWHDYSGPSTNKQKFYNGGIVISGRRKLETVPGPTQRMK
jgi:predicted double-glycine peptidase